MPPEVEDILSFRSQRFLLLVFLVVTFFIIIYIFWLKIFLSRKRILPDYMKCMFLSSLYMDGFFLFQGHVGEILKMFDYPVPVVKDCDYVWVCTGLCVCVCVRYREKERES